MPQRSRDDIREEIREELVSWARDYSGGREQEPEPCVRNGIEFWCVGHNASHEFYAGVDAMGRMFRFAIGDVPDEEWPEQLEGEDDLEYVRRALGGDIKEVFNFQGYYGHF